MAAPMRAILRVEGYRQDEIENLLGNFERELAGVIHSAQNILMRRLTLRQDGAMTRGNVASVGRLPEMWRDALRVAGLDALVESFVEEFNGQIPHFEEILSLLNERVKQPLPPLKWTGADLDAFAVRQVATIRQIESVVASAGQAAMRQALFEMGGADPAALAVVIAEQTSKSIGQARTVADTGISTFYRSVQDAGYRHIETGLKKGLLRYEYFGPDDKLTRPFCIKLIRPHPITRRRRTLTREEIDELDNGQTEDVFLTGGGWNCRHSWLIAEVT